MLAVLAIVQSSEMRAALTWISSRLLVAALCQQEERTPVLSPSKSHWVSWVFWESWEPLHPRFFLAFRYYPFHLPYPSFVSLLVFCSRTCASAQIHREDLRTRSNEPVMR